MEDKKEKPTSTNINCEKTIYRKSSKTIENTHFLYRDFFAAIVIGYNLCYNI